MNFATRNEMLLSREVEGARNGRCCRRCFTRLEGVGLHTPQHCVPGPRFLR